MTTAETQYRHWLRTWSDIRAHLPYLADRARGHVLELGVREGVSTSALLTGIERHGGHLWSVDRDGGSGGVFDGHPRWTFVQADSCDVAEVEAAGLPDALDVLFLDTEHDHDSVAAEIKTWGERVKPGGCILVHDTDLSPDACRAVRAWAADRGYPVHFRPESNGLGVVNVPPPPVRVAAIIPNFNMSEATDALVERISQTDTPLDVIVVDDGSPTPSKYTALALRRQVRPNQARIMGLHYADVLARQYGVDYYAYWLLATSARFADDNPGDILTYLVRFLQDTDDAVCVLPSYAPGSRAPWAGLLGDRGSGGPRRVWFVEWTAALLKAPWFDSVGRLDPENLLGWGTEYEPARAARKAGLHFYVHEGVHIVKDSIGAHEQGRRRRTVREYWDDAGREMSRLMRRRYGPDWQRVMEDGNEGLT